MLLVIASFGSKALDYGETDASDSTAGDSFDGVSARQSLKLSYILS